MEEKENYYAYVKQILEIFKKSELTAEDRQALENFVLNHFAKTEQFLNSDRFEENLQSEIALGEQVIMLAYSNETSEAGRIVSQRFNQKMQESTTTAQEKGIGRVRINPNFQMVAKEENNDDLGVRGFTNAVILIMITVLLGLVLAAFIINR